MLNIDGRSAGQMAVRRVDAAGVDALARLPKDYSGPVVIGHNKLVWWTGRVAIGLRHQKGPVVPQRTQT